MSRLWPLGRSSDSELHRSRLWFADKLKRLARGTAPAKTFLHCIELIAFTIFFVMGDTSTRRSTHRTGLSARRDCNSSYFFLACTQRMQLFFLLHARTQPIAPAAHTAHCTATRLSCMQILDDPVVSVATS